MHRCENDHSNRACQDAIEYCQENIDGTFHVGNDEYSNTVNYCPICGIPSPMQSLKLSLDGNNIFTELEKAQAFKTFVHTTLDAMGIPATFPDGEHSKEGCRIGDRLAWIDKYLIADKYLASCRTVIFKEIEQEFASAESKFKPFNSAHEGYAVLLEEVDELWQEVMKKKQFRNYALMRKECIQVAAMAVRFISNIIDNKVHGNEINTTPDINNPIHKP